MFESAIDVCIHGVSECILQLRNRCTPSVCSQGLTGYACVSSFIALSTGPVTAFARTATDQIRADAERRSNIILESQRCFLLQLGKDIAQGSFSFVRFFLLAYLDRGEMLN